MNYELDCLWELLIMLCKVFIFASWSILNLEFFLSMQKYFSEAVD